MGQCHGILAIGIAILVGLPCIGRGDVSVTRMDYHGWKGAYRVSNNKVELVFVPQIGRIMRYAFVGGKNVLWENTSLRGKSVDTKNPPKEWQNFGGDKLWPAPQERWNWPPDPVLDGAAESVRILPNKHLLVTGHNSLKSGLRFIREIALDPTGTTVTLCNTIQNIGNQPDEWSVWEVAQTDEPDKVVLPTNSARNFPEGYYTFPSDPPLPEQISLTDGVVNFTRDRRHSAKIGADSSLGWIEAQKGSLRFRVSASFTPEATYPDLGCGQEVWSNADPTKYMELELLSPIRRLAPNETYTFTTQWNISKSTPAP